MLSIKKKTNTILQCRFNKYSVSLLVAGKGRLMMYHKLLFENIIPHLRCLI